ncbi:hypothetical protein V8J88_10170 [Massilia sp. W12]|uniref:hypothetical protein n=1 Tax=Massilia sp. W12 TaxID=3126507 RepID=UPI0030D1D6A3
MQTDQSDSAANGAPDPENEKNGMAAYAKSGMQIVLTGARLGWLLASRVLGWSVFGLAVNIYLFWHLGPQMQKIWPHEAGNLLSMAGASFHLLLLLLSLLLCIAGFWITGYKQGLDQCIYFLARQHLRDVLQTVLRLTGWYRPADNTQTPAAAGGADTLPDSQEAQQAALQTAIAQSNYSWLTRKALHLMFADSRMSAALWQTRMDYKNGAKGRAESAKEAANVIAEHSDGAWFEPDLWLPAIMLSVNLIVVLTIAYWN